MHSLLCSPLGKEKLNDSVAITGVGRSGTTIFGSLVHSLENVEYFYEPTMFGPIMALGDDFSQKMLLEYYFYDELLLGALAGRTINLNRFDASSIHHVKGQECIIKRLSKSFPRQQLDLMAKTAKLVFKSISYSDHLIKYKKYYPGASLIYMFREPVGVISSIIEKKWFAPKEACNSTMSQYKYVDGLSVPIWVSDDFAKEYYNLSELDRCAYYYLKNVKEAANSGEFIWIDYGNLLTNPRAVMDVVCDILDTNPSHKTESILSNIRRTDKKRDIELLNKVSSEFSEILNYA